jgi:hypothetical protein
MRFFHKKAIIEERQATVHDVKEFCRRHLRYRERANHFAIGRYLAFLGVSDEEQEELGLNKRFTFKPDELVFPQLGGEQPESTPMGAGIAGLATLAVGGALAAWSYFTQTPVAIPAISGMLTLGLSWIMIRYGIRTNKILNFLKIYPIRAGPFGFLFDFRTIATLGTTQRSSPTELDVGTAESVPYNSG